MYGLPSQLPDDAVQALRNNLRGITAFRDELKDLAKPTSRFGYQMSDYVEQARDKLRAGYHGERDRFYVPYADALNQLDQLREKQTLNTQFSTSKTKLVSILSRYIKGLQRGFQEHDAEAGSTPPA